MQLSTRSDIRIPQAGVANPPFKPFVFLFRNGYSDSLCLRTFGLTPKKRSYQHSYSHLSWQLPGPNQIRQLPAGLIDVSGDRCFETLFSWHGLRLELVDGVIRAVPVQMRGLR